MVNAMITISEHANRVLNIVKAKYGLKDKSEAIEVVAAEYEKKILEPGFKPEFVQEVLKAKKHGKFKKVKSVERLFE
ncbi:antitoxin [Candidatus Micrarchaeota archaeon]|nr:MAG: antitoxin [Candidatus Micrarchaeota archaeon]